jgi:hypothetical protein
MVDQVKDKMELYGMGRKEKASEIERTVFQ